MASVKVIDEQHQVHRGCYYPDAICIHDKSEIRAKEYNWNPIGVVEVNICQDYDVPGCYLAMDECILKLFGTNVNIDKTECRTEALHVYIKSCWLILR